MDTKVLIIFFAALLFFSACSQVVIGGAEDMCELEAFFNLDKTERAAVIHKCRPEQQVALYVAWSKATIPGNIDHAEDLAKSGERILPALLDRLERDEELSDELSKPELLIVLDIMQRAGYYSVAQDKDLMARIENSVFRMKEPHLKDWALEIVSQIKEISEESSDP